ncbi:MAG: RNA 2',3'-cyclic phosphodiesterase [Candidatus Omnitrophica bacterium]|nr:RNA 2',3'-cyclic phosphodiesterase [Candidatus Omnitrophota bacterium]
MTYRTFLALPLAEAFQHEISNFLYRLRKKNGGIKWVLPEQVHITLHFFGPTTGDQILEIKKRMQSVASTYHPLRLALSEMGFFPDASRPRVIWIGMTGDTARLIEIQSSIEKDLAAAGFEIEDRRFRPHATLGRVRPHQGRPPIRGENFKDVFFVPTSLKTIDRIVLFQSILSSSGSRYEVLETFPFSGLASSSS